MHRWRVAFERTAPGAHAEFLRSLGIEAEEIVAIRARSRDGACRAIDPDIEPPLPGSPSRESEESRCQSRPAPLARSTHSS